ncbi:MAG: hypothetical protein A3I02_16160 [Betaproteobacteria bacterium RIFCSPLOWO2_02_FULL_67_26]|nr:MAG: hypothetical protein A3I02_16160 [Betaproteobacteria bacterium RIFCSPLOWO2_02_FULL_67_26]
MNAVACRPHCRIAPGSGTPIGQNSQRSPRSVPGTMPSGRNTLRRPPAGRATERNASSSTKAYSNAAPGETAPTTMRSR